MSSTLIPGLPLPSFQSTQDSLTILDRDYKHLQKQLQSLLDAQSTGLSVGLGQPAPQELRNPTGRELSSHRTSTRSSSSPPSRHDEQEEQITLAAARSGIHATLLSLAQTKAAEHGALEVALSKHLTFLENTQRLADKKTHLEEEINAIEQGSEKDNLAELDHEEKKLAAEILALKDELAVKEARYADIQTKKNQKQNSYEAKLSSWREALKAVDKKVKEDVLVGLGLGEGGGVREVKGKGKQGDEDDVWALPENRRTLEMVKEAVENEVTSLQDQVDFVDSEGAACVEGAHSWRMVVKTVIGVENRLRREITRLDKTQSTTEEFMSHTQEDVNEGMKGLLVQMDQAVEVMEAELQQAQEKKWMPLIVAVGAELEAISQSQEMLEETFGLTQMALNTMKDTNDDEQEAQGQSDATDTETVTQSGTQAHSLLANTSHEEDDGPSADLLISHNEEE